MKGYKINREELDRELEHFQLRIEALLPEYSELTSKKELSPEELSNLGDLEHYLFELNAKISLIKDRIQQNLFGHTLDIYYKLKNESQNGDTLAEIKLKRMKASFEDSLQSGQIINWN